MNRHIDKIKLKIEPLRQEILNHKVYSVIKNVDDLQIFMQYHVYAVWDFMSLLKTLQNNLTCTTIPWYPKGSGDTGHLINEIVVGEESDIDKDGNRKSHFELYLDAMNECGADTTPIDTFIQAIRQTNDISHAFNIALTPIVAREFVDFTFKIISSDKDYLQSAIFTFGREDLIPGMFISLINDIDNSFPDSITIFKYYLERHIEVDGGQHSQLALQMTNNLCGNNEQYWQEAEQVTIQSLQKRIYLWDGIYGKIMARKTIAANLI